MRPPYDDFAEFDLDVADGATAEQVLRQKIHEQRRLASRRAHGPGSKRGRDDYEDDDEDYEDYEDSDEYDDYDDYDDDEFDSYSRSGMD